MTLFLFVKQFVDMLYKFRVLDYIMVIWALLLLLYQVALVRPNIKKVFTLSDGIILLLAGALTISFFRSGNGYQIYFKVLSAFLIYFVGRVYYDRIKESTGALVSSAYIIIFINLLVRIRHFGFGLTKVTDAGGDLYYYDTDMAFAMILAMVFIVMFGKNCILKIVSIFLFCPYMVFCSDAGIQAVLMLAIYVILAIYLMERIVGKVTVFNNTLIYVMIAFLLIVLVIYLPIIGINLGNVVPRLFKGKFLNQGNMHVRYSEWKEVLISIKEQGMCAILFGSGMGAEIKVQSLYIKIYYSLGCIGLALTILLIINIMYYVSKIKDRKTFYLALIMAVLLLGTGVTVNSMETTQMSWFPLLFAGMVVSSVQEDKLIES